MRPRPGRQVVGRLCAGDDTRPRFRGPRPIVTANRSGPLGSGASTGVVVVNAAVSTAYWPTPRQPPRPGLETSGQAVPGPADSAGGCHPGCWPSRPAPRPAPDHRVGGLGPLPTLTNHARGDPPGAWLARVLRMVPLCAKERAVAVRTCSTKASRVRSALRGACRGRPRPAALRVGTGVGLTRVRHLVADARGAAPIDRPRPCYPEASSAGSGPARLLIEDRCDQAPC
jgi:hypothetical protein